MSAFTRPGDVATQAFARSLGVTWAGGSDEMPPERLDATIIFATDGNARSAGASRNPEGRVVCAGIHMSDIPAFPYELLWEERQLARANEALADLHAGKFEGAAVLCP